jgi:O-acetylserine/cysteine efflux transporter
VRSRIPPRDAALVVVVVALWGFNFVPIRWSLDEVPPFALAALRFLLAAVPMVFFVRRPAMPAWLVVCYGLAIGVGQFGLLFLGIALGMPAGLASLIVQAQVFFTIGLAAWTFGDRIAPRQIVGTLLAGAGIALLAWTRASGGAAASVLGLIVVLGAALSWAIGNTLAKHAAREGGAPDMFALVVWSSLAAPLPLAALSFAMEGGTAPLHAILGMSLRVWLCVIFMAVGATLFGFAVWNKMLHRYSAATVAPFALLVPVVGLASGWWWLGESLNGLQIAAGALVLAGLALNLLQK